MRSAFLDTEVVEYVAGLPGSLKIRHGETKYILKQAAARYFPEEMIRRPKEGFLMPITQWVLGELQPWIRETLSPERLAVHGLFDLARVEDAGRPRCTPRGRLQSRQQGAGTRRIFQEWYEHVSVLMASPMGAMPASVDFSPDTPRVPFSLSMLGWALNEEAEPRGVHRPRWRAPGCAHVGLRAHPARRWQHRPYVGDRHASTSTRARG